MPKSKRNARPVWPNGRRMETADKQSVCSFASLLKGAKRAMRSVRWKNSVARYEVRLTENLWKLHQELMDDTYGTREGQTFPIYYPKYREVTAVKLEDRIVQSSFVVNVIYPQVISKMNPNNCACLKGKGVDYARNRLKEILKDCSPDAYALKIDMKNYFGSINHRIMIDVMSKYITDEWSRWFYADVINSNGKDVGIGLGSEINQLSASVLLNDLDEVLDNGKYIRYADDVLFIGTKEECKAALETARRITSGLFLKISEGKTYIQRIRYPLAFLGFTFLRHDNGKVTLKRLREKVKDEKRKLKKMYIKGIPEERIAEHYQSVRATMAKGCRSGVVKLDRYHKQVKKAGG